MQLELAACSSGVLRAGSGHSWATWGTLWRRWPSVLQRRMLHMFKQSWKCIGDRVGGEYKQEYNLQDQYGGGSRRPPPYSASSAAELLLSSAAQAAYSPLLPPSYSPLQQVALQPPPFLSVGSTNQVFSINSCVGLSSYGCFFFPGNMSHRLKDLPPVH